jgi:hypothetical protein
MEENSDEEEAAEVPVPGRSRGRRDRPAEQPPIVPEAKSNKKPKVDTDEQVAQLLTAKPVIGNADIE